jgi:hypothetical protein
MNPPAPFGNPFRSGRVTAVRPEDAVAEYRARIGAAIANLRMLDRPEEVFREFGRQHERDHAYWCNIARKLRDLRGRRLGCWCCVWRPDQPEFPCHAVCLAQFANTRRDDD